ncbi:MAG: PIN domain-containing protein [Acidobacteria bacterium]|nr:PIN domain-containing protein [Acidobacteriota bacterium]
MIKVVLDTNIIVSANLQAQGLPALALRLAANRKVQMYVSPAILTVLAIRQSAAALNTSVSAAVLRVFCTARFHSHSVGNMRI